MTVGEFEQPCNLSRVVAFSRHAMSLVYVLVLGQVLIEKFFCAGPVGDEVWILALILAPYGPEQRNQPTSHL